MNINHSPETETQPYRFHWKLDPAIIQKTIYDKIKCKEKVNVAHIYGIIKGKLGITYQGNTRCDGIAYKTELEQIEKFKQLYNKKCDHFDTARSTSQWAG